MRLLPFACALPLFTSAQPFIDLFSLNGLASTGVDREEVSATLPVRLDTAGRLLVLDPYFVQWHTRTEGSCYEPALDNAVEETMQGGGGALTYVTPLGTGRWKLAVAGIGRYHWLEEQRQGDIQYGGVLLASRVYRPALTLRWGVYANYDAFGWFARPLFGIDWRIDEKHNVFGVLPGSINYEHEWTSWFHWGVSFRAYTCSFGVRDGNYRRIDENPLGVFGDVYLTRNVVLRLEGGWSCIRQIRGGPGDPLYDPASTDKFGYADHEFIDEPYVRVMLAYRLRLDGPKLP